LSPLSGAGIKPLRAALALGGLSVTAGFGWLAISRTDGALAFPIWLILAVCLLHLVQQAFCGCAWRAVTAGLRQSRFWFFRARWIRASVAALVPVSGVGAAIVAVRLAVKRGISLDIAVASLTLDATIEMITQILFTIIGIILLLAITPERQFLSWSVPAVIVATTLVVAFITAQRRGGLKLVEAGIARLANRWPRLAPMAEARLHDGLLRLQQYRRAALVSASWHFAAWLLGAAEVWLILYAIGHETSIADCIIVESLAMLARSAGFFVPGGMGVQEAGLVLAGTLVGLPLEAAIAVGILKRLREIVVSVPGLLVWQWSEGKWLFGGADRTSSVTNSSASRSN
jgi:putative membrane protein